MLNVTSWISRLSPISTAPAMVVTDLSGARLFRAEGDGASLWVADLARFGGGEAPLADHLFLSVDGRNFHQLRVVERQESAILTDTPGLLPALAMYRDQDMALVFGERDDPSSGLLLLLDRIPSKDVLERAVFFQAASSDASVSVRRAGEGPRVRAAEKDREPDRRIRQAQETVLAFDRGRQRSENYRLDRGLEEGSSWTSTTSFGRIEENVRQRLGASSVYRSAPLRILTIGPGQGRMENELKDIFSEFLSIDTFSLHDTIAPENWEAFDQVFVGNLDTHRLPEGYDLIVSIFGSSYAVDQRRAAGQIIDALNPGGEAYFLATGEMILGHEPEVLGSDEIVFLRNRCGLSYQTVPHPENTLKTGFIFESVFIRKSRSLLRADVLLAPQSRMEEISREAWDAARLVAQSRNRIVDPTATPLDIERFRERLAFKRERFRRQGHRTSIETVLFLWPWIELQGIFVKH